MKGPGPLYIFAPASAYAGPGFRFANNVCEPPAAHSAAFEIRSGGMYAARSGPGGRFVYHFPAVTEGDRKMMQLEKMKISFFRRVLTLSTPRPPEQPLRGSCAGEILYWAEYRQFTWAVTTTSPD